MKKLACIVVFGLLTACQSMPKNQQDCLPSQLAKACMNQSLADIYFLDSQGRPVMVVLSDDRQQAEVFGSVLPNGLIMTAVKGGFISDDGQFRLIKGQAGWKLVSR